MLRISAGAAIVGSFLLVVAIAACSGDAEPVAPVAAETTLVSSPESVTLGPQRLIFQLRDGVTRFGGPEQSAVVELDTLGEEAVTLPAAWVWAEEEAGTGAYVIETSFDAAGTWLATLAVDGLRGEPATFAVFENAPMPRPGEPAPASVSQTLATAPIAELTTDPDPDPRLYDTSIDDALAAGSPMVIVFSTPKYCTTSVCGPMLDLVKSRQDDHDDVTFIHVEVYEDLGPGETELQPRSAIVEWGLPTEPWVYTIDSSGTVDAVFEGVMGAGEFDRALAQLR